MTVQPVCHTGKQPTREEAEQISGIQQGEVDGKPSTGITASTSLRIPEQWKNGWSNAEHQKNFSCDISVFKTLHYKTS